MTGEDEHLEAMYEDANGNLHGIGSPEWEDDEDENLEYDADETYAMEQVLYPHHDPEEEE